MSKKIVTSDKDEKTDAYYSEELSRAAVGRLFDNDEDEAGEDSPPPITSAYVTGFERSTAKDKNPTKKRDRPPRREPEEPIKPVVEEPPEEEEIEEPPIDRQRRREATTTRLLNSAQPDDNFEAQRRERRRNPMPKPAVRANVQSERKAREPQNPRGMEEQHPDEDLDTFRSRYNSKEIFSPPRPNRPVRTERKGVRKNPGMRPADRDSETISPIRMIMAGTIFAVLALITILTWQLVSTRNRFKDAEERLVIAELDLERANNALLQERDAHDYAMQNMRAQLEALQEDDSNPATPDNNTTTPRPDGDPIPTPQPTHTLPTTHTVARGETLDSIARRYFGNSETRTLDHIVAANPRITNRNNIHIGWELQITPME